MSIAMDIRQYIKANYVYILYLLLGLAAIGFIIGVNTALFLFIFLFLFTVSCYSFVGIYNYFRNIKEKGLIWQILAAIIFGTITYFKYGTYPLLKILSLSLVISTVIIFYIIFTKRKHY